jgi:hypothetical protein
MYLLFGFINEHMQLSASIQYDTVITLHHLLFVKLQLIKAYIL